MNGPHFSERVTILGFFGEDRTELATSAFVQQAVESASDPSLSMKQVRIFFKDSDDVAEEMHVSTTSTTYGGYDALGRTGTETETNADTAPHSRSTTPLLERRAGLNAISVRQADLLSRRQCGRPVKAALASQTYVAIASNDRIQPARCRSAPGDMGFAAGGGCGRCGISI